MADISTDILRQVTARKCAIPRYAAADFDLADVELLSEIWFADECYKSIRTETLEKRKAEAILSTLKA